MSFMDFFKRPDFNAGVEEWRSNANAVFYIHCLSGSRSAQAASVLKSMGYTNVTNIGGISAYHGEVVKQ